ncbi:HD domain protein [Niveomyces insectorum RCEF 264]|uniref:5'-deoxynucleotidase n=1 Tax=Niveomyces insectorum RCEF 264 TaxID=1081102 RepID=A0A167YMT3_9HYPO|nr:HD domain protein [Niveomyces insectorum RCEF 264]
MAETNRLEANAEPPPKKTPSGAELGFVPTPRVAGEWTVHKAAAAIPTGLPEEDSSSPLPYFHLLELLKTTKREGWRRFGISQGESIADHMYRMSLITMLAPPSLASRLDMERCMKMCLIHDMAEALVGDITPVDGVSKPEKSRREASTMDYITQNLLGKVHNGASGVGNDIRAIWQEYEDSKTPESLFVHDVDKMELLLQMVEYEKRAQGQVDLGEFAYVATKMTLPETQAWAAEVLQERDAFWGAREHVHGNQGAAGGVSAETARLQDAYYERDGAGTTE